ncbi:hypothetical protein AA2016_5797 (plasmid) [Aminobacter aminovorans]|uniref:Uncharacterized protein n=1 Tax=Aminobacter aminovorans TaxID=83263 RepID=A0AAC9ATH9_AMIAI|nr:hypothetical protein AA2016_5797 [Aminobacter aminovorans]
MYSLFFTSIVYYYIKASRHRHNELRQLLVGMTTTFSAPRHIVEVVDPPYVERHMALAFDKGKVSA